MRKIIFTVIALTLWLNAAPVILDNEILIKVFEIIALVVAFAILIFFLPKRKNLSLKGIPDTFLDLSPELRKQALSYAWNIGTKVLDNLPIKSFKLTLIQLINIVAILILGVLTLACFLGKGPVGLFILLLSLTFIFLYLFLKEKLEIEYAIETEQFERLQGEKLATIASTFVNENVESWVKDIRTNRVDNGILEVADITPENIYALYSSDASVFSDGRMPDSSLNLTFILVGKYLIVIDKIYIDIKKISYSYICKDTPTLEYVSEKDDWNSEEFYYQDVVEIGYKPKDEGTANIEFGGNLFISLANGTLKEYPTSKKHIGSLFTDIRSRVREAKLN